MKNKNIQIIIIAVIIILITIVYLSIKKGENKMEIDGGIVKNQILKGYSENINSKEITYFEYQGYGFQVSCELNNNILHIKSKGGNSSKRDESYFKLDYNSKNKNLLKELQTIIEKYKISKNNGYEYEVAGLPEGLGDTISVTYKTGEKIWKYSNQTPTINEETSNAIYKAFHKDAKNNSLDFTSKGSNTLLYDDATNDYLQGTWKGIHFGKEYKVVFNENNIKIYEDNVLTDDVEYTIVQGNIVPNKLKEGIENPKDRYDYEEFKTISTISKKNDFTLVTYFMKDSYSTCDLIKQK
ncbi:MAG: hypothetical protein IKG40_03515 [Bacilli bacterium]|nr:hypothetical protein [Bacilli bacterium]